MIVGLQLGKELHRTVMTVLQGQAADMATVEEGGQSPAADHFQDIIAQASQDISVLMLGHIAQGRDRTLEDIGIMQGQAEGTPSAPQQQ